MPFVRLRRGEKYEQIVVDDKKKSKDETPVEGKSENERKTE